jgi:hypothetical protein
MKNKKPNAELVWKQIEDDLVSRLRLSVADRVVYWHLLRHTRLEGKPRLRFSVDWLARGVHLSPSTVRPAVNRLVSRGVLRLLHCSKAGHVVEVLVPDEIRAASPDLPDGISFRVPPPGSPGVANFEDLDFLKTEALRKAIHARERGRCFYCLRQLTPQTRCLDHVVPQSQFGGNSHRNLVSCCMKCNSQKGELSAIDFFRRLYRERRLSDSELAGRLRTLDALASGKLPPRVDHPACPEPRGKCSLRGTTANGLTRKGRPPLHPAAP